MRVRANGLCLPDLDTLAAMETGRNWTPAKRPGEPLYRPAINNGLWAEDIITDGLVLYVPCWLYSGGKFPSVDAYKHTCTVTGALWTPQGRDFNGTTDKIVVPYASGLDLTGTDEVTILAWVRPHDITAAQDAIHDNRSYMLQVTSVAGTNRVRALIYDGDWSEIANGVTPLVVGTWHYLAMVYNGVTVKGYVNGVEDCSVNEAGNMQYFGADKANYIGNLTGGGAPFHGDLGALWVYKNALSVANMTHNMNATGWRLK